MTRGCIQTIVRPTFLLQIFSKIESTESMSRTLPRESDQIRDLLRLGWREPVDGLLHLFLAGHFVSAARFHMERHALVSHNLDPKTHYLERVISTLANAKKYDSWSDPPKEYHRLDERGQASIDEMVPKPLRTRRLISLTRRSGSKRSGWRCST